MSSEWRDNLPNRIRRDLFFPAASPPREAKERGWNTGSPVEYGRSGNPTPKHKHKAITSYTAQVERRAGRRRRCGRSLRVNAPLPPEAKKILKIWQRNCAFWSIGYLNKYVVSIAPLSTPAFTPPHPLFRKLLFFACFRFLIFHPFFPRVTDPICPKRRPWVRLLLFCLSRTVLAKITNLPSFVCWSLCLRVRL